MQLLAGLFVNTWPVGAEHLQHNISVSIFTLIMHLQMYDDLNKMFVSVVCMIHEKDL